MSYIIASIIFGALLVIVWFVFGKLKPTVYLNKVGENAAVVSSDIEASKKQVEKIRSRRFVVGIGAVFGMCLLTYLLLAAAGPAKKVQAALWPTSTPTASNTPTVTPTRTPTNTPRFSPTPNIARTQTAIARTGSPTPTKTIAPSSGSGGGGNTITIIHTRLVIITRVIHVAQTVIVIASNTPLVSVTPSLTPAIAPTSTITETPTSTVTFTPTETETPTP
jgi:hypothetical protein